MSASKIEREQKREKENNRGTEKEGAGESNEIAGILEAHICIMRAPCFDLSSSEMIGSVSAPLQCHCVELRYADVLKTSWHE